MQNNDPATATGDDHSAKLEKKSDAKRQVRMNTQVHVMYEDGDSTMENLAEDKFTASNKACVEKPTGHQVELVDLSKATPGGECKQQ